MFGNWFDESRLFNVSRFKGGERVLLGIPDPQVWLAYLLSILSGLLCVIYGVWKWHSDT